MAPRRRVGHSVSFSPFHLSCNKNDFINYFPKHSQVPKLSDHSDFSHTILYVGEGLEKKLCFCKFHDHDSRLPSHHPEMPVPKVQRLFDLHKDCQVCEKYECSKFSYTMLYVWNYGFLINRIEEMRGRRGRVFKTPNPTIDTRP